MEQKFKTAFNELNKAQKEAVEAIEGPVLVVAGPGTGKTQLLSLRVANILHQTDVLPGNILCLTFTDNAARNMRERLQSIIGQPAYHVAIHTFHSFGSEIISQYGDYFTSRRLLQPIDELGRYELMHQIFDGLAHDNPLSAKVGDDYIFLKDSLSAIGWLKQNALTPDELRKIINKNEQFVESIHEQLGETFAQSPSPKYLGQYRTLLASIETLKTNNLFGFADYASICATELAIALEQVPADGRFAPTITAWRNVWCQKDANGKHVLKDSGRNYRKMLALADVYQKFVTAMAEQGLYDFDDMIIEVVHAMESNSELLYNLQERYQYILVDEFQDTNKAQLRILTNLGNNPVNEGSPNIMAVGDDDQAIYAFQGAETSNMFEFANQYNATKIVALTDNYRSTDTILDASYSIANQITDRLEANLAQAHKQLKAQASYDTAELDHEVFISELAQYDWLANQIDDYIKQGIAPEQIAVIAPRHRYLERLMPYLGQLGLPVAYERRENVLESPIIIQLLTMSRLIIALANNRQADVDMLMSQALGYDFWQIPAEEVLELSLQSYKNYEHWLPLMLDSKNQQLKDIAKWFMALAKDSKLEPLEYMLDLLIGDLNDGQDSEYDELIDAGSDSKTNRFISPLRQFYFGSAQYEKATDIYLALLGQLSSLRQHLRQWKPGQTIYIEDLIKFTDLYQTAGLKIVDTNPHTQTTNAVQVMTAYKAKGLEFEAVFVINAQDEIWGPTAHSRGSRLSLPKNLPIEPASDNDNDKLRLFFVALTRAKRILHITSYQQSLENKLSPTLSFMINDQAEVLNANFEPKQIDRPVPAQAVQILTTDWAYRFRQVIADKQSLFEPILANYKLSVTHLNNFLDVAGSGPNYFLLHNLLHFPSAPTPAAAYGDAIHKTLQWSQLELKSNNQLPSIKQIQAYFNDILSRKQLRAPEHHSLEQRGLKALEMYYAQRANNILAVDQFERNFTNEGVVIEGAHLSGKIDKIHYQNQTDIEVIDFKTGKPAQSWQGKDDYEKIKLHKYRQQLMFYKLLIENSSSFSGKQVVSGGLEFIEANEQGELVNDLSANFDATELANFTKLIGVVWQHITELNFPDVTDYSKNISGIKKFEADLLSGEI